MAISIIERAAAIGVQLVHVDPMSPEKEAEAWEYLLFRQKRRPAKKPVGIHLSKDGALMIGEGMIETMTHEEVAADFHRRLQEGDPWAVNLNHLLCTTGRPRVSKA